jgi:cytochrome d ubiquinol oxidase subunit II
MHGALWISVKTSGPLSERASQFANRAWYPLLIVAVAFLVYTKFATKLYNNYVGIPVLFIVPLLAVASLIGIKAFAMKGKSLPAFISSCLTILTVTFTGVIGLFPNLIPSSIDTRYSLTIFNSSSSPYTLKIMTAVALIFVPIVIAYQIWNYRIFKQKIDPSEILKKGKSY